jgi:hypothetical protein
MAKRCIKRNQQQVLLQAPKLQALQQPLSLLQPLARLLPEQGSYQSLREAKNKARMTSHLCCCCSSK